MGSLFGSPPSAPERDPALVQAEKDASALAAKERTDEENRKKEEQSAFGANLRGRRSLLSGSFTGFGQRGAFAPKGQ